MHAEIVMIGTELLLGEIVDTNANRLALALRDIGLDLYYKTTVGDNLARITEVSRLGFGSVGCHYHLRRHRSDGGRCYAPSGCGCNRT